MSNCNFNHMCFNDMACKVNKIICLTILCIFASHFSQIKVDFSSICGLNFASYFYKSSGPYFVVFLALDMSSFCEIPPKHLQNKRFPPSCCFGFATSSLSRIDH